MMQTQTIIRLWIEGIATGHGTDKTVRRLKCAMRTLATKHTTSLSLAGWSHRATLHLPTDHLEVEPLPNVITGVLEAAA